MKTFEKLNNRWHSRLPDIGGFYTDGMFFGAIYENYYYAVAGWSVPVSIALMQRKAFELRRLSISKDAPKNTASRMLSIMSKIIKKEKPYYKTLVSYQDTEVHTGTIYRAAGWKQTRVSIKGEQNWVKTHPRKAKLIVTDACKIRWEKDLHSTCTL